MMPFDPDRYLERIGHRPHVALSEEGLRALHRHQLLAIPFENFDVLLGRPIRLDGGSLFDKMVGRRRGGYCFELNGLFLQALGHFGFAARPLLARVHVSGRVMGRGHQLSLVTIGGREWLADVGFGSFTMRAPIPFEHDLINEHFGQHLRLTRVAPWGTMLQTRAAEAAEAAERWQDLYSFDLEHVGPGDITYGNHYTSTHPDSIFVRNRMAALPTPEGRVTLLNDHLKIVKNSSETNYRLPDDQRYLEAVRSHFGIDLDASYDLLPPLNDESG